MIINSNISIYTFRYFYGSGVYRNPHVIVYILKANIITFLYVDHHNFVYEKSAEIIKKWETEIED
jgi:hypothetical protein